MLDSCRVTDAMDESTLPGMSVIGFWAFAKATAATSVTKLSFMVTWTCVQAHHVFNRLIFLTSGPHMWFTVIRRTVNLLQSTLA